MRTVIVSNMMSLDGYVGNDDDSANQLPIGPDVDDFHRYNVERLRAASTLVSGRSSFLTFEGYWPPIENDPSASALHREISRLNNRAEKIVVSNSLVIPENSPWLTSTQVVARDAAAEVVRRLKGQVGADILIFGSPTMWNSLLSDGLVDELHLMIAPMVLGSGVPAFRHGVPDDFSLLETRHIAPADSVVLRYGLTEQARRTR